MRKGKKVPARKLAALVGLALLATALWPAGVRGEKLERQLLKSAPLILQKLRNLGYRSVGVLKFRVQIGQETIKDDVGTLNHLMAERLETALAIATSPEAEQQLRLARRASQVAAGMESHPSHLLADGRKVLLGASYKPAWGSGPIQVDALLSGVVSVESNFRTMHVGILVFGDKQPDLTMLQGFVAETDGLILNELGRSFHKRGMPGEEDVPGEAKRVYDHPQEAFPLRDRPAAQLQIFFDDQPVKLEYSDRDHTAVIPEPRTGQKVTMLLQRVDEGPQRLAAVLKINGENTLYRERSPDVDCSKWVLEPGAKRQPIPILGFQKPNNREAEEFRVLSREESRGKEMYYGTEVGTISLTLFTESEQSGTIPPGEDADLLAIAKACFPEKPAKDAAELKAQILRMATASPAKTPLNAPPPVAAAKPRWRGIIVGGEAIEREVVPVEFVSAAEPFFSVVIRYYRSQSRPTLHHDE